MTTKPKIITPKIPASPLTPLKKTDVNVLYSAMVNSVEPTIAPTTKL